MVAASSKYRLEIQFTRPDRIRVTDRAVGIACGPNGSSEIVITNGAAGSFTVHGNVITIIPDLDSRGFASADWSAFRDTFGQSSDTVRGPKRLRVEHAGDSLTLSKLESPGELHFQRERPK